MIFRGICLFLIYSQILQAHANSSFRILGRGIEDRKTGEVISLVCVGDLVAGSTVPSCQKIRPMKYDPIKKTSDWISVEAFDLGSEFGRMDEEPSPEMIKKYVRKLNKAILYHRSRQNHERNARIYGAIAVILTLGFGAFIITKSEQNAAENPQGPGLPTGPVLLSWAGVMALVMGIGVLIKSPVFAKSGVITEAMIDQNGWNWSVKPRKISHRSFQWVNRYFSTW